MKNFTTSFSNVNGIFEERFRFAIAHGWQRTAFSLHTHIKFLPDSPQTTLWCPKRVENTILTRNKVLVTLTPMTCFQKKKKNVFQCCDDRDFTSRFGFFSNYILWIIIDVIKKSKYKLKQIIDILSYQQRVFWEISDNEQKSSKNMDKDYKYTNSIVPYHIRRMWRR